VEAPFTSRTKLTDPQKLACERVETETLRGVDSKVSCLHHEAKPCGFLGMGKTLFYPKMDE